MCDSFLACLRIRCWLLAALLIAAAPLGAAELHDAVRDRDTAQLERLLKAHPEFVDTRDTDGRSALHLAADAGYLDGVKLLVNFGAGVNLTDHLGRTPLLLAEEGKHDAVVAYLRQHGAGAVDFSKINDSALSGFTWCIFAGIAAFGLLVFVKIVTKRRKTPEELLADEMND